MLNFNDTFDEHENLNLPQNDQLYYIYRPQQ